MKKYKKVKSSFFIKKVKKIPEHMKVFLTDYDKKSYNSFDCYIKQVEILGKTKTVGYALKKEGTETELISVFSINEDRVKEIPIEFYDSFKDEEGLSNILNDIVESAVKNGATQLDCLGDFLEAHYKKYFSEIELKDYPFDNSFNIDYIEIEDYNLLKGTFSIQKKDNMYK